METEAPTNGRTETYEYWPRRMVSTVSEETLELWKKDLGAKADALRAELAKVQGGVSQIDEEFARRGDSRKRRTEAHAR